MRAGLGAPADPTWSCRLADLNAQPSKPTLGEGDLKPLCREFQRQLSPSLETEILAKITMVTIVTGPLLTTERNDLETHCSYPMGGMPTCTLAGGHSRARASFSFSRRSLEI